MTDNLKKIIEFCEKKLLKRLLIPKRLLKGKIESGSKILLRKLLEEVQNDR